jgi:hypothetical protein
MVPIGSSVDSLVPSTHYHTSLELHFFDLGDRALRKTSEAGANPTAPAVA